MADDEVVAEAWDTWRGEVAHARAVYADLDLDGPRSPVTDPLAESNY